MKKIICFILCLLTVLSISSVAFAAGEQIHFSHDAFNYGFFTTGSVPQKNDTRLFIKLDYALTNTEPDALDVRLWFRPCVDRTYNYCGNAIILEPGEMGSSVMTTSSYVRRVHLRIEDCDNVIPTIRMQGYATLFNR